MSIVRFKRGVLQFARFSLIGALNAVIDLTVLNILLLLWQHANTLELILINSFAYLVAVLNSYIWNTRLTFRGEAIFSTREKTLFAVQALVSLLISNGVFVLFIYWLGFTSFPMWLVHNGAKGISMALSSICSFFLMKAFIFKRIDATR
jgi:putative flippase GtrA